MLCGGGVAVFDSLQQTHARTLFHGEELATGTLSSLHEGNVGFAAGAGVLLRWDNRGSCGPGRVAQQGFRGRKAVLLLLLGCKRYRRLRNNFRTLCRLFMLRLIIR